MTLRLSLNKQRLLTDASTAMLSPSLFESEPAWHTSILDAIMPLSGAYKAAIRVPDGDGFRVTPLGFEQAAVDEYKAYYHQFDFGRALGGRPALGAVFSRNVYYARNLRDLFKTEYYSDYICRYKVFDALCLSDRTDNHEQSATLYLWHEQELDHDSRGESLALLQLLAPAFRAGIAHFRRLSDHRRELFAVVDTFPHGCAMFDAGGIVLHRNPALEALLADPSIRLQLLSSIEAVLLALRSGREPTRSATESSTRPSRVFLTRVREYRIDGSLLCPRSPGEPHFLVTVKPSSDGYELDESSIQIASTAGLTRREVEVASLLCSGLTNDEIATRLGISAHTARHHTENVYRKLSVKSKRGARKALAGSALR